MGMSLACAQVDDSDAGNATNVIGESNGESTAVNLDDETGFVAMFDGETLAGWRRINGEATYRVEDDCIVGDVGDGTPINTFLRTEAIYRDFEFRVDVKMDVPGNSGIQFRSQQGEPSDRIPDGRVFGYQNELDQRLDRRWTGGIYEEGRRGWLHPLEGDAFAEARAAFDIEDWNTIVIRAEGRHLRTWVNGVPCSDFVDEADEFLSEGFFALQVHSGAQGVIRWRNPRILVLNPQD